MRIVARLGLLITLVGARRAADAHERPHSPIPRTVLVAGRPSDSFVIPVALDAHAGSLYVVADCPRSICLKVVQSPSGTLRRTIPLRQAYEGMTDVPHTGHLFLAQPTAQANAISMALLDARDGTLLRTIILPLVPDGVTVTSAAEHAFIGSAGVMYCPAGHCALMGSGVALLDAHSGHLLRVFHAPSQIVCVGADGRAGRVVIGSGGPSPSISTLAWGTGRLVRRLSIASQPERIVVDERTGRAFVLAAPAYAGPAPLGAGQVFVLDTRSGRVLRSLTLTSVPTDIAVDEQTSRVFVAEVGAGHWRGRIVQPGHGAAQARHGGLLSGPGIAWWLLAGAGAIQALDARTGAPVRRSRVGVAPLALAVDGVRDRVFVVNAGGHPVAIESAAAPVTLQGPQVARGSLSVLDARSGQVQQTITLGVTPWNIFLDADHHQAFIGDRGDDRRPGSVLRLDTSGL